MPETPGESRTGSLETRKMIGLVLSLLQFKGARVSAYSFRRVTVHHSEGGMVV